MNLPEINALPGCDWTPKKTKSYFITALVLLPILTFLASFFNELDLLERRFSVFGLLMSIPSEVFAASYTLVVVTILCYLRRGMQSFYRPYGALWMAMMVLLSVSAVAELFTIGSDDMKSPAVIVSALAECIAWGVGLSMGIRLSVSYAGRMAVMARRLKVASVFGVIGYGLMLFVSVMVDGRDEEVLAMFLMPVLSIVITFYILLIRAMITALDMLDKGSELGWSDDIYMPDGTGHPVADELHIPVGVGPDWKPMGVVAEPASAQSVVSRVCKTLPDTVRNFDLSGSMQSVINAIRHFASTKAAKYLLCAVALLALAGICYKVLHKDEVESLFADVKAPEVSLDRVIDNGEYTLQGFSLYEYEVKDEDSGSTKSHQWVRESTLTLWFHPEDTDDELGIPVLAHFYVGGRYSENHYGIGFLKNNTLTIYQAKEVGIRYGTSFIVPRPYICYPDRISQCMVAINLEDNLSIMFTADVSNIANFKASIHCDSFEYLTEFYDCLLYNLLMAETPTSVYRSDDGTEIRVQFFKAPENDMGIKAIAAGEIYDSPEIGYDDVFTGPLFDNSVFPIVATSCLVEIGDAKLNKDDIVVTNQDNEDKEITMPLIGRMIFDNVMLEKSIAQLRWDSIYHDSDNIEPEEDASEESILATVDKMYDDIPNVDFDDYVKNMRNAGFDKISISGNFSGYARNINDIVLFPYDANLENLEECDRWTIVGRNKTASIEGVIHSYYPQLVWEGDLNGNGKDEFGILRAYSASNYYSYQLYEFDEDVESNILYAYPIGNPIKVSCPILYENGLTVDDIVTKAGGGKVRIITYEIAENGRKTLNQKICAL